MEDWLEELRSNAFSRKSVLCLGLDPVLERFPPQYRQMGVYEAITSYFTEIVDAFLEENLVPTIKPNYAFYAQYGFDGLRALKTIIDRYKGKLEITLDSKRNDIGKTAVAYSKEVFEFWNVDSCTITPYLGSETLSPFFEKGRAYVLCKTSNPGSAELQDQVLKTWAGTELMQEQDIEPTIYAFVAQRCLELHETTYPGKVGLVVGATSVAINTVVKITDNQLPFMIPGVGAQGGDINVVVNAIESNFWIHRINVSSALTYAWEKQPSLSPVKAAVETGKNYVKKIYHALQDNA